jgi:hypothetical protein
MLYYQIIGVFIQKLLFINPLFLINFSESVLMNGNFRRRIKYIIRDDRLGFYVEFTEIGVEAFLNQPFFFIS